MRIQFCSVTPGEVICTQFAADASLVKGQVLHKKPEVNKGKFLKFCAETRIKTVSINNNSSVQFLPAAKN
jgi:hypothetical protein